MDLGFIWGLEFSRDLGCILTLGFGAYCGFSPTPGKLIPKL